MFFFFFCIIFLLLFFILLKLTFNQRVFFYIFFESMSSRSGLESGCVRSSSRCLWFQGVLVFPNPFGSIWSIVTTLLRLPPQDRWQPWFGLGVFCFCFSVSVSVQIKRVLIYSRVSWIDFTTIRRHSQAENQVLPTGIRISGKDQRDNPLLTTGTGPRNKVISLRWNDSGQWSECHENDIRLYSSSGSWWDAEHTRGM